MRILAPLAALLLLAATAFAGDTEIPVAVSGRVLDEHGKPMVGVTVHAGVYEPGGHMKTGPDGRFALRLRAKKVPLVVWTNGYLQYEREHPSGTHDVEIRMVVGAKVRGQLVVPGDVAMPKAVRILSRRAHGSSQTAAVAPDGRFQIGGFAQARSVRLGVWADGLEPLILFDRRLRTDAPLDLGEVRLGRGRPVVIQVRDHEGRPIEAARVRVESMEWSAFMWDRMSDAAGDVRITGAPTDRLRATVWGPHTDSAAWTALVPAGRVEQGRVRVTVEHPVTLHGTLVWRGVGPAPWAGEHGIQVTVAVNDDPTRPRYWHGRTAGKGSAEILVHGCVPGDWKGAEIRVAVGKRWSVSRRTLTIPRVKKPRDRFELGEIPVSAP